MGRSWHAWCASAGYGPLLKASEDERLSFDAFLFYQPDANGREAAGLGLEAYDVSTTDSAVLSDLSHHLHGRRQIFTSEREIDAGNVCDVLQMALATHERNRAEIQFLKRYERGIQPILDRVKQYNNEVCNKIVVNIANEIITFKTSEFAGEPIQYVSRGNGGERDVPVKVAEINNMMLSEGKQTKDLLLAHEMFTCGVGYRLVFHETEEADEDWLDEAPFEMYIPDAENTFIVRRSDVTKKPAMGVTYVYLDPPSQEIEYTVYTKNETFTIRQGGKDLRITDRKRHNFGMVSLIEYPCNPDYMGAFEPVVPLLDAINTTESNRVDGVEQFIQALMVFDGVDISREDFLELKDLGAIKLPSTPNANGGKKLYYLNEQLDQTQTQTLVDSMYQKVLQIVGMPSQGDASSGDSSNNGAVIMKNGWWHAEARAMETQCMWKEAETSFLKVVLKICKDTNTLSGLKISDLEPRFWRQSYEDLLVKTQSFSTLRSSGMPAIQAFTFSHLSRDPESDAIVYDEYQERLAEELDRLNGVSEDIPLSEDSTTDPTTADGIQAQAESDADTGSSSKGDWAICPVCGKKFIKKEPNQKYSSIACANKARRSTPRYGGMTVGN